MATSSGCGAGRTEQMMLLRTPIAAWQTAWTPWWHWREDQLRRTQHTHVASAAAMGDRVARGGGEAVGGACIQGGLLAGGRTVARDV